MHVPVCKRLDIMTRECEVVLVLNSVREICAFPGCFGKTAFPGRVGKINLEELGKKCMIYRREFTKYDIYSAFQDYLEVWEFKKVFLEV